MNNIGFSWLGGKQKHLKWLLPLLPPCYHFIDIFGGSASVILNRDPSPIDTYNDIYSEIVIFFKVLRNQKQELLEQLVLTPYSREEFIGAINNEPSKLSDLERARLTFIRILQGRMADPFAKSKHDWFLGKKETKTTRWIKKVKGLELIVSRLKQIQLENRPAFEIIQAYDSSNTLFYCDPPYLSSVRTSSRCYKNEMEIDDHIELAQLLHNIKGKAAISSYRCETYDKLYKDWQRIDAHPKKSSIYKGERLESLWINYPPPQKQLF